MTAHHKTMHTPPPLVVAAVCALYLVPLAVFGQARFELDEKGIGIVNGTAGELRFLLPALGQSERGGEYAGPTRATRTGDGIELQYGSGARGLLTASGPDRVRIALTDLPPGVRWLRLQSRIPGLHNNGGRWAVDDRPLTPFPSEMPADHRLFAGRAQSLSLVHPTGANVALTLPPSTTVELSDQRKWNWGIFLLNAWAFISPEQHPNASFELAIGPAPGAPAVPLKLIDRYGQHKPKQFVGKITSDDELRADREADEVYYASLVPPSRDSFGGLPGSREQLGLSRTGFFHIERLSDGKQVLVDPEGNLFFQLGVCSINPSNDYTLIKGREAIYDEIPPITDPVFATAYRDGNPAHFSFYLANLIRKFGKPYDGPAYIDRWITRLRAWGFNSAGSYGFDAKLMPVAEERNFPYTQFLPIDKGVAPILPLRHNVWDPFADGVAERMDAAFAKTAALRGNDPRVIGWFVSNEPALEDVPRVVPGLKGSEHAAKRHLAAMLREKYRDIGRFNQAWKTNLVKLEDITDAALTVATPEASEDALAFYQAFLEQRYTLVRAAFDKHFKNHLLIGDRWTPGTAGSQVLVEVAGQYFDVVSVNYYSYGIDKQFLGNIHRWAGNKPILLSEFHYCTREQGLTGGIRQVADQVERGKAYRNYVEQAISTGYVVGIQWFIALDQAATGRYFDGYNGEAANTGLVNVADRPYKDFLALASETNHGVYDVILGTRAPFAFDDPRFTMQRGGKAKIVQINRMTKPFVADGAITEWPGTPPTQIGSDGLVLGENSDGFDVQFRLAWDDQNLYLFAEVSDPTPMQNPGPDTVLWEGDSIELFIGKDEFNRPGNLVFSDRQVILRAAAPDAGQTPSRTINSPGDEQIRCPVTVVPAVGKTGYAIEASIPHTATGFRPTAGQEVLFDIAVNDATNGRRTLVWNGTAANSKERSVWGRAEFAN